MDSENLCRLGYSVPEIAATLGISLPLAYQLVNRADFPAVRLGRRIIVPVDGLRRWMDEHSGGVGA